jgi:hypothetical protein
VKYCRKPDTGAVGMAFAKKSADEAYFLSRPFGILLVLP